MSYTAFSVAQDEVPTSTKWNYLGGNDAHFYSFLGDTLEWRSWTPTWSGLTVGSGTVTAYYTRVGNTVIGRLRFNFGTGSAVTGPIFSLPVTAHANYTTIQHIVGSCYLEDFTVTGHTGTVRTQNTTTAGIFALGVADGTSSYVTNIAATPFTWASNDYFTCNFAYEAA